MEIINAPIIKLVSGGIIYQITLSSGMIITTPSGFGTTEPAIESSPVIVADDGRILSSPKVREESVMNPFYSK